MSNGLTSTPWSFRDCAQYPRPAPISTTGTSPEKRLIVFTANLHKTPLQTSAISTICNEIVPPASHNAMKDILMSCQARKAMLEQDCIHFGDQPSRLLFDNQRNKWQALVEASLVIQDVIQAGVSAVQMGGKIKPVLASVKAIRSRGDTRPYRV